MTLTLSRAKPVKTEGINYNERHRLGVFAAIETDDLLEVYARLKALEYGREWEKPLCCTQTERGRDTKCHPSLLRGNQDKPIHL